MTIVFLMLVLAGCVTPSPQSRREHADQLAAESGWQRLRIPADKFVLTAYVPQNTAQADVLTVYIEGDGLAWLTKHQASTNPTPVYPLALRLALRHPDGVAAYLGRPCQYVEEDDATGCTQSYWTGARFAPEVIEASSQAISVLKQRVGASRVVLVGYSGGGAVAALVAARRKDVARLVTVAGSLDHRVWTTMHQVTPMDESLNPADAWQALQDVPQRHLVGGRDRVVSREVVESYASRFAPERRPEVVVMPEFDHVCCWVENWAALYGN